MSNYDDALSLIENEVNRDCEYYVYSQLRDCIDTIEDDCKLLKSENAKLRELVSDFDKCLTEAARLAYIQGHMTIYDGTLLDSLHPRMRELGVEVD